MSADDIEQQVRRADLLLQQLDANRNGVLEAAEIGDGRARWMVERMVRQAGMEPTYPMPVARVREGVQRYYQTMATQPGGMMPGMMPGGPPMFPGGPAALPAGGPAGSPTPAGQQASAPPAAPAAPLVPGFGVAATSTVSVAGFTAATAAPGAATGRFIVGGTSAASKVGASSEPAKPEDEKIRVYAKSLLAQHDKNKSGQLERDEWEDLKDAEQIDRDHNGIITMDELMASLLAYSRKPSETAGHGSSESRSGSGGDSFKSVPYRFRTAAEMLKPGLPDWFAPKDANHDGMVSMAEFTREWSEPKVAEFAKYDLNGDGVITQDECLAVLPRDKGTKGTDKKADASTVTAAAVGPPPGRFGGPPGSPGGAPPASPGGPSPGRLGGPPTGPPTGPPPGRR